MLYRHLMESKAVHAIQHEGTTLYCMSHGLAGVAEGRADVAAMCLNAIDFIAKDLKTTLMEQASAAYLLDGTAHVRSGGELLRALRAVLTDQAGGEGCAHGETVRIILAAKIGSQ